MPAYKYPQSVTQVNHPAYDQFWSPGEVTVYSGIYKCPGCGQEITSTAGHPLPPQDHHQHRYDQGRILCRLAVAATHV